MRRCLHLARSGLGRTWPNPSVGCVLIRNGTPLASARTADRGRPHAEALALAASGDASGATAYISLEPCAHQGKTAPCAGSLLEAGIARAVIGCRDPDPRVSGQGIAMLREGGIDITEGVLAGEASAIIAGHRSRIACTRPRLTLKIAATLDGAVGLTGHSRTPVTGHRARALVESLRAEHDAVLIGAGTARIDNPLLIPGNPGLADNPPVRVVLDTGLSMATDLRLVTSARQAPLWIFHAIRASADRQAALKRAGAELIALDAPEGEFLPLDAALAMLAERGIGRVLCEGGPTLATTLLAANRVDELVWLTAGMFFGEAGLPAHSGAATDGFRLIAQQRLGEDVASFWRPVTPDFGKANSGIPNG